MTLNKITFFDFAGGEVQSPERLCPVESQGGWDQDSAVAPDVASVCGLHVLPVAGDGTVLHQLHTAHLQHVPSRGEELRHTHHAKQQQVIQKHLQV